MIEIHDSSGKHSHITVVCIILFDGRHAVNEGGNKTRIQFKDFVVVSQVLFRSSDIRGHRKGVVGDGCRPMD